MARMKPKTKAGQLPTLANVRVSLGRMQTKAEQVVVRMRRDAERFMARSRNEVLKEVREVERRVLKTFHAATEERVARLEGRITKLEQTVEELRRPTGERAA